jgi:carbon monoxide dehydrogenase subunit G
MNRYTLWGSVGAATSIVVEGGKFYLRGSIYGSLNRRVRRPRPRVTVNITGNLKVARGTKVIHSGVVIAGDAVNEGGRLYIDATAKVEGKIKTIKGETKVEPMPVIPGARRRDADE